MKRTTSITLLSFTLALPAGLGGMPGQSASGKPTAEQLGYICDFLKPLDWARPFDNIGSPLQMFGLSRPAKAPNDGRLNAE